MEYDLYNPLLPTQRQDFHKFSQLESNFMAAGGGRSIHLRNHAASAFQYLSASDDFDQFLPYLAMNYFDRCVSRHPLPNLESENLLQNLNLFVVCCLLIAGKMVKGDSFSVAEFQDERNLKCEPEKIMRMEIEILKGLEWRTRSVTAVCFVEFVSPFFQLQDLQSTEQLKVRGLQKIIHLQGDVKFAKFRPSTVAATAFLAACLELDQSQFRLAWNNISACSFFDQEDLDGCVEQMEYKGKQSDEKKAVRAEKGVESMKNLQLNWSAEFSAERLGFPPHPRRRHSLCSFVSRILCCNCLLPK